MRKIIDSLPKYLEALEAKAPILHSKSGKWKIPGKALRIIRKIFRIKESPSKELIAFQKFLADVEMQNLYFNASVDKMSAQKKFYDEVQRVARIIVNKHAGSKSEQIQGMCSAIDFTIIKLRYRIQEENGGAKTLTTEEVNNDLVEKVKEKIKTWQTLDEKYHYTQELDFTLQVQQICQHPEIVNYLLDENKVSVISAVQKKKRKKRQKEEKVIVRNARNVHAYFQSVIRNGLNAQVVSQYPSMSEQLTKNLMAVRIGAISRRILTIDSANQTDDSSVKQLNLLMENKKVNLLNKNQKVKFSNGFNLSIKEIFKIVSENDEKFY